MTKTIVIATGGTGGHIFPGLAVADELIVKGYKIVWIGTRTGLEANLIPSHNIDIYYITIAGIRGKAWSAQVLALFNILVAIFQSITILYKLNPCAVLGMGGFVAGPVGIAAWLLRKKLIIHEQNAIAGTCNRILAYFADGVLESFPDSFMLNNRHKNKIILTGNPVRKKLLTSLAVVDNILKQDRLFNILVLGGSRGATFLNQLVPEALGELANIKILHQTGEQDFNTTYNLYSHKNIKNVHEIKPFIDNMLAAYAMADLVICRAGASTVFEIMAMGIASILVPLPGAIDDHQTKNAAYLANNNAAIVVKQAELNAAILRDLVMQLIADHNRLAAIKAAARSLYEPYKLNNSAERISNLVQ